MPKFTIEEIEARLLEAVRTARANGYKVQFGEWGVSLDDSGGTPIWVADGDCLCPMGCVIVGKEEDCDTTEDMDSAAARELGCTARQVSNFVVGFDEAKLIAPEFDEDGFYNLGVKLRQQIGGGA